jgi:broad specificity phosphatase PhoE
MESARQGMINHAQARFARNQAIIQAARAQGKDLSKMSALQRDAFARNVGSGRPLHPETDKLLLKEWAKPAAAPPTPQMARGGVVRPESNRKVSGRIPEENRKAGGSVEDRVRGSANVPLSPEGIQEATQLGQNLARKGFGRRGDTITPGVLDRAQQTAQAIAQFAPHAKMQKPDPTLDTWRLGAIEGQPTEAVGGQIEDLIKNPDKVPPPGTISSEAPESFASFKNRYLPPWKARIQAYLQQPNAKHVFISHGRGTRLIHGWIAKGMPDNLDVDPSYVLAENDKPGDVHRIAPGSGGKLKITAVHPEQSSGRLKQGIYLVRHAKTVFNKSDGDPTKPGAANWHRGGVALPVVEPPS